MRYFSSLFHYANKRQNKLTYLNATEMRFARYKDYHHSPPVGSVVSDIGHRELKMEELVIVNPLL